MTATIKVDLYVSETQEKVKWGFEEGGWHISSCFFSSGCYMVVDHPTRRGGPYRDWNRARLAIARHYDEVHNEFSENEFSERLLEQCSDYAYYTDDLVDFSKFSTALCGKYNNTDIIRILFNLLSLKIMTEGILLNEDK